MNAVAAKAVAFGEAATPGFAGYARQVVADARVPAAEGMRVVAGGTDTHLIVVDPAPPGVEGRVARGRLAAVGVVLDCCVLPGTGGRGLRLGTAAVTTQGMGEEAMARVAVLLAGVVRGAMTARRGREEVEELVRDCPPYPD